MDPPAVGTLLDPSGAPVSREVLLRELLPGRTILVHYEEEPLWMERLLIASESTPDRTGTGYWYVCTPDLDRYIEEVTGTGDWCDAVHMMDDMGNTPISLRGHCYRFAGTDYPDDEELIRWYHAGRAEFEAENRYCLEATRFVDFNGHPFSVSYTLQWIQPDAPLVHAPRPLHADDFWGVKTDTNRKEKDGQLQSTQRTALNRSNEYEPWTHRLRGKLPSTRQNSDEQT